MILMKIETTGLITKTLPYEGVLTKFEFPNLFDRVILVRYVLLLLSRCYFSEIWVYLAENLPFGI